MSQTVKVTFKTEYDKKENPKIVNAKPIIQKVQHHYIGGRISTVSGDVWDVERNPNQKESTYVTIKPKVVKEDSK